MARPIEGQAVQAKRRINHEDRGVLLSGPDRFVTLGRDDSVAQASLGFLPDQEQVAQVADMDADGKLRGTLSKTPGSRGVGVGLRLAEQLGHIVLGIVSGEGQDLIVAVKRCCHQIAPWALVFNRRVTR